MTIVRPLPREIAGIAVPNDDVSAATWRWVQRSLPDYLVTHSVRTYCWGATIAAVEHWKFDRRVFWTAALLHDVGLARLARNTMCFEIEGGEFARRFLEHRGMSPDDADRAAIAIILHMRPAVTLDDGVEAVLLDRATSLDVRGEGFDAVAPVRSGVVDAFPRRDFDRHFLAAIAREANARSGCQSARLLNETDLAGWMERSPWAGSGTGS